MRADRSEPFSAFVVSAQVGLVRFGYLLLGDAHRAEDLVQAALLKVYDRWHRIDDPAAYTRAVMVNEASRWRRRRWTGERPDAAPGATLAGDDPTDAADTVDAVRHALLRLPIEQRAVLVLRYFEQRSEAEIATLLGVAPGTVKSRGSRGLEALRASGAFDDDLRRSPDGS